MFEHDRECTVPIYEWRWWPSTYNERLRLGWCLVLHLAEQGDRFIEGLDLEHHVRYRTEHLRVLHIELEAVGDDSHGPALVDLSL